MKPFGSMFAAEVNLPSKFVYVKIATFAKRGLPSSTKPLVGGIGMHVLADHYKEAERPAIASDHEGTPTPGGRSISTPYSSVSAERAAS